MPRRQSNFDDITKAFLTVPWWVGPIVIGAIYGILKYAAPMLFLSSPTSALFAPVFKALAPLAAIFFTCAWLAALGAKWMRRRRLDRQHDIESIRQLSWHDFELLVGEVFRRQGYQVAERGGPQPDGGVDLVLRRAGKRILVQCKHYRSSKVDVRVVRELAGVVAHDKADGGIVVVTGAFTKPARDFAPGANITLIDGDTLWNEIADLRRAKQKAGTPAITEAPGTSPSEQMTPHPFETSQPQSSAPACPLCETPMVKRKARRGPQANSYFWGCANFPKCRGIRAI